MSDKKKRSAVPRFALSRDNSTLEFVPIDENEFYRWKEALASFTI